MKLHLFLPALLFGVAHAASSDVCYIGYAMDVYCAARGFLLDTGDRSLQNPEKHSIHCLVDVPICSNSGYEVLADKPNSDGRHCRVFKLDAFGNGELLKLARASGNPAPPGAAACTTCTGGGTQEKGFRVAIIGTPTGSGTPRTIAVSSVVTADVGCGAVPLAQNVDEHAECQTLEDYYVAHGSLMIFGWALLLPCGVIVASRLKHLGPIWFKLHMALQISGLAVAFAGWVIALSQFQHFVFDSGATNKMLAHGVCGCCVMSLGLLQPINAILRPHKEEGAAKSKARRLWEALHKSSGYIALLLALVTLSLGVTLIPNFTTEFAGALGAALAVCVAVLIVAAYSSLKAGKKHATLKAGKKHAKASGSV